MTALEWPRPIALGLTGLALLALPPATPARRRIRTLMRPEPRSTGVRARLAAEHLWLAPAAVGLLTAAFGGLLVGGCAAAGSVGAIRALRGRLARRTGAEDRAALLEAVAALAEELRAGRPPPEALRAAAQLRPATRPGRALRAAAEASALGGDPADAVRAAADQPFTRMEGSGRRGVRPAADAVSSDGLRRVAAVWRVSLRSGAPLADTLGRLERDLRAAAQQRSQLLADLAGPRATAVLLAGLPVVGLVLGAGMGADPAHVLLHTVPGQVALVVGVALDGVGLWWTGRILQSAGAGRR